MRHSHVRRYLLCATVALAAAFAALGVTGRSAAPTPATHTVAFSFSRVPVAPSADIEESNSSSWQ